MLACNRTLLFLWTNHLSSWTVFYADKKWEHAFCSINTIFLSDKHSVSLFTLFCMVFHISFFEKGKCYAKREKFSIYVSRVLNENAPYKSFLLFISALNNCWWIKNNIEAHKVCRIKKWPNLGTKSNFNPIYLKFPLILTRSHRLSMHCVTISF